MNKQEYIAKIEELAGEDFKLELEGLRVKELSIVLKGLQHDEIVAELAELNQGYEKDLEELNKSLAEAESVPRDKKAPIVVGKIDKVAIEMTVPQARIHEDGYAPGIYTREQIKADPKLLALLVKRGASYLVARN